MARTTARPVSCSMPARLIIVTVRNAAVSAPSPESIPSTMLPKNSAMSVACTWSIKRCAYSGPVSSCLKCERPKPGWMHWRRIPPRCCSRSTMATRAPALCAASAAAMPAGPPPITTTSKACVDIDATAPASARPSRISSVAILAHSLQWSLYQPRTGILQQHLAGVAAQLARQDRYHAALAKTTLAPTHAGTAAALDTLD